MTNGAPRSSAGAARGRWLTAGLVLGVLAASGVVRADASPSPGGLGFVPLSPLRIMDTRAGIGVRPGPLGKGEQLVLTVGGLDGVPADAAAVVLNVTELNGTAPSFLTVFPDGDALPTVSNLNWTDAQARPNLVSVRLGAGKARFYNFAGNVDVVADLAGYYTAGSAAPPAAADAGYSAFGATPRVLEVLAGDRVGTTFELQHLSVGPGRYLINATVQLDNAPAGGAIVAAECFVLGSTGAMSFVARTAVTSSAPGTSVLTVLDALTASSAGDVSLSCHGTADDTAGHATLTAVSSQMNIQQVGTLNGA